MESLFIGSGVSEDETMRIHAQEMLKNLERLINHSSDASEHLVDAHLYLFPHLPGVSDKFALEVLAWLKQHIETPRPAKPYASITDNEHARATYSVSTEPAMNTQKIFAFLRDHYWDTLEDQRDLLEAHLANCEKIISQAQSSLPFRAYD